MQATVGVINPREVAGAVDKPVDRGTIEGLLAVAVSALKGSPWQPNKTDCFRNPQGDPLAGSTSKGLPHWSEVSRPMRRVRATHGRKDPDIG
jgi:hypothetical protein